MIFMRAVGRVARCMKGGVANRRYLRMCALTTNVPYISQTLEKNMTDLQSESSAPAQKRKPSIYDQYEEGHSRFVGKHIGGRWKFVSEKALIGSVIWVTIATCCR